MIHIDRTFREDVKFSSASACLRNIIPVCMVMMMAEVWRSFGSNISQEPLDNWYIDDIIDRCYALCFQGQFSDTKIVLSQAELACVLAIVPLLFLGTIDNLCVLSLRLPFPHLAVPHVK